VGTGKDDETASRRVWDGIRVPLLFHIEPLEA
jgi:hypothetical protein